MRAWLLYMFLWSCFLDTAHGQRFIPLVENMAASFRGMATYGKHTVWVSGTNGTVGYSKNQGKNWTWVNPQGYQTFDFRDIAVFSDREAVIMSAGTPAVILRTTDSGKSWSEVFRDNRPELFLNALAFDGCYGYALGDPIDGFFQLLRTTDKGKTWKNVSQEMMLYADEGEVAFAASGSSIQLVKNVLYVGTGGSYASFFAYNPGALRVDKYDCPILSGTNSTGVFAIDFRDRNQGIVVGGDYKNDSFNKNNVLLTNDGGISWQQPETPVSGYMSDVECLTGEILLATGTVGTDMSKDGGKNWMKIDSRSFNVLGKSNDKRFIYLAGSDGNIYKLHFD